MAISSKFFTFFLGFSCSFLSFAMTLQEAVQYSVINSPRVLKTVKVCLANEQAYKGAAGGYLPSLDATGAAGYEHSENSSTRSQATGSSNNVTLFRTEMGLEARQMLFDGFSTKHNVGRNRFKLNASAWAVADEANNHAMRVAEAYINVLRHREIVAGAEENVAIHKRTSDMIIRRSESGVSRNTDAVQAKGRLAQAASNLNSAQGDLLNSEIAFFRVSGVRVNKFVTIKLHQGCIPKTERDAVKRAIEYHPALRAANSDILEAYSQHKEAKSTMMPRIDLVGSVSYNRNIDGVRGRNNDQSIMLEGRWNLINGGKDFRRRRETAYLVQEAATIRNNTYRQVIEGTRLAWTSHEVNLRLVDDYKLHMDSSRDTIDAYAKQFQLGQRTLLDLLNSENEYIASRNVYTHTKYDILLSKIRILSSMGLLNDSLKVDLSPLGVVSHDLENIMDYPDIFNDAGQYTTEEDLSKKNYDTNTPKNKVLNDGLVKKQNEARLKYYDTRLYGQVTEQNKVSSTKREIKYPSNKIIKRKNYTNARIVDKPSIHKAKINKKLSGDTYTIQLLATGNEIAVKKFIKDTGLDGVASYYRAKKRNGDDWYLVTYGSYNSSLAAQEAIKDLPGKLVAYKPWYRSSKSMEKAKLVYGNALENPIA